MEYLCEEKDKIEEYIPTGGRYRFLEFQLVEGEPGEPNVPLECQRSETCKYNYNCPDNRYSYFCAKFVTEEEELATGQACVSENLCGKK